MPDQFYIVEGVRRAVAARELGLPTLPATLERPGHPDHDFDVPLDRLHAGRDSPPRMEPRFLRVDYGLQDPAQRPSLPRIILVPLANASGGYTVPLQSVRLTP